MFVERIELTTMHVLTDRLRCVWLQSINGCFSGEGDLDITEIDITESAITNFQEIDITESAITEFDITRNWKLL